MLSASIVCGVAHCVTHYTVCYTVIENREVILQYTLELTIN